MAPDRPVLRSVVLGLATILVVGLAAVVPDFHLGHDGGEGCVLCVAAHGAGTAALSAPTVPPEPGGPALDPAAPPPAQAPTVCLQRRGGRAPPALR